MFLITISYLSLAVLIFMTFVAEPREVGVDMREDHLVVAEAPNRTA